MSTILGCTKLIYRIKMPSAATTASRRLLNMEQVFFPCGRVNRLNGSKKEKNIIIFWSEFLMPVSTVSLKLISAI